MDTGSGETGRKGSVPVENFLMQFCRIHSSGATPRQNPKGNRNFYFIVAREACHANFFARAKALKVLSMVPSAAVDRTGQQIQKLGAIFETSVRYSKTIFQAL